MRSRPNPDSVNLPSVSVTAVCVNPAAAAENTMFVRCSSGKSAQVLVSIALTRRPRSLAAGGEAGSRPEQALEAARA